MMALLMKTALIPDHPMPDHPIPDHRTVSQLYFYTIFQLHLNFGFRFALIHILMKLSPQNFTNDTTAVLSRHMQTFVAIWWSELELEFHRS